MRDQWTSLGSLTIALLALTPTLAADKPVVRQGTNDDLLYKVFHSPVTVEIPLDSFVGFPSRKAWTAPTTEYFYCDGVTIERIQLKKVTAGQVGGNDLYDAIRVMVDLRTRTQEDDMAADIEFRLVDGDETLILGRFVDLQAPAGDAAGHSATFAMAQKDRDAWFGGQKTHPWLRVTMTTRAN